MPSPPDRRDAISLSGVLLTAGLATLVKLRKGTFAWTFVLLSILGAIVILGSALLSARRGIDRVIHALATV
jgi:hypothetical protein